MAGVGGSAFDMKKMYELYFGTKPIKFQDKSSPGKNPDEQTIDVDFDSNQSDTTKTSRLGTPFYEKMANDALGREYYLPVTLGGLKLPYCVLRVSCRKTLVETPLVNRKGNIIEGINIENYAFKLRGFLINSINELPDEDITNLKDVFEVDSSVVMRCALSDIFLSGDDKVVIKSFDLPEVKGVKNVRPFEMDLVQDSEFSLIVE